MTTEAFYVKTPLFRKNLILFMKMLNKQFVIFLVIFLVKLSSDNSIECETLDIPPEVIECLEITDKGSIKYLNDGTDCCSALRQLDIIEQINPTQQCDQNQRIEVFKWKEYLEIQLNNSVYGNCERRQKPYYDGFICVQTDVNECDC